MKNFIETLAKHEGAAITLASILCGRVIGQVARGFAEDEEVVLQANLYAALAKAYPASVVPVPKMFGRILRNADDNMSALAGLDLTAEEKAEWAESMGESEKDRLQNSAHALHALIKEQSACADLKSWYDLTALAQHSLAVRTEKNLQGSISRYASWNSEEGARLHKISEEAVAPLAELVSNLCESLKDDLDQARSQGVNVAVRNAA